jgi:O-antigen/teichoic acid export membrane protein
VLDWPGLVLLAILAHPVVLVLLGQQWLAVIPLLQVMAIATLAWFPVVLTSPVLLAIGATRDRMLADLIGRSGAAMVLCSSAYLGIAHFGVMAMAVSQLISVPFQMVVALCFVRRHIAFGWSEFSAALWKSAVVTASSAAGPLCVVALSSSGPDLSVGSLALAVLLAVAGWVAGVVATRHPVLLEVRHGAGALRAMTAYNGMLTAGER